METKKIKDLQPGDYVSTDDVNLLKFLGFLNFEKDVVYDDMNTEEKLRELLSLDCKNNCFLAFKETISRPPKFYSLDKFKDVSPNLDFTVKFDIDKEVNIVHPKFELGSYVDNKLERCVQIDRITYFDEEFIYNMNMRECYLVQNARPYIDPMKIPSTIEEMYRMFNKTIVAQQKKIDMLESRINQNFRF